jgi:hypothetical protein
MELGFKIKADKADKLIAKIQDRLGEEEVVTFLARCNNLRPLLDTIMLTNERLLGVSGSDIRYEVSHAAVLDVVADAKRDRITLYRSDGTEVTFKMVKVEDHRPLVSALNAARSVPLAGVGVDPEAMETLAVAAKEASNSRTGLQLEAISDGFPERYAHLVEPLTGLLDEAAAAAFRNDIVDEERAIWRGHELASSAGLIAIRAPQWFERALLKRVAAGDIRRGVDLLGTVGSGVTVMSDRIVQKDTCHVIDGNVRASVEVNGQKIQTTRPTLTRMAFGSVLPGSALLVGLAMPKKQTKDTRVANFVIVHPKWRIIERIDPDKAHEVNALAAQLNVVAEAIEKTDAKVEQTSIAVPELVQPVAAETSTSVVDEIVRLADLRDRGVISQDQFDALVNRL